MVSRPLRICVIGDLSDPKDEGMKKTTLKFAQMLSKNHDVLRLHVWNVFQPKFWLKLRGFKPEIVFYVGGPTLLSFMIVKAACVYCVLTVGSHPRAVIFALHPLLPPLLERTSSVIKPDLILVQSQRSQIRFRKLGLRTQFLPIGVDTEKFIPVLSSQKRLLRQKYGLKDTEFIVLHVGSVRRNRGLEILNKVQMKKGNRVLIIGSTSMPFDHSVKLELTSSGCLVWHRYFLSIEELYQLSDLYVFPVVDKMGSIELPLSVMEAMACNLPVISTKFGALPRILKEEEGVTFVDKVNEIPSRIEQIQNGNFPIRTRERAIPYSWESVTRSLVGCFRKLVEE